MNLTEIPEIGTERNEEFKTSFMINAGTYYIKVFNEDNTGHYSLATWIQSDNFIILYIGSTKNIRAYIPHIALLVLITIIYFLIKRIFFRRKA